MAPREGQELTLAQALQQPEDLKRPKRIEGKVDAVERPYERFDEPRPDAKQREEGR
jgi:hypothetical protein